MDVPETDWAWLAGLIDGEGYIGVRRYRRDCKPYEFIRIGMADLQPLLRAAGMTGRNMATRPQVRMGKRPAFELSWYGRYAAQVIQRVYKHMTAKRLCALIAYNAYMQRRHYFNRHTPTWIMRRLDVCSELSKCAMGVQYLKLPKWFVEPDMSCIL